MNAIAQGVVLYAKVEVPESYRKFDGDHYHVFVMRVGTMTMHVVKEGKNGNVMENVPDVCWETIDSLREQIRSL
jgi:hypothetical protein